MDHNTVWNEICFFMEKNRNASERDFQTVVEFIFEKIGWSQYRGEVVSQESIPVGSAQSVKPDIIIRNNGENILVVELKKPNAVLSGRNTDQLVSYMRLLRLRFGILIGETLQVYYELPNDNKPPVKISDIAFVKDSKVGSDFIAVFGKDDFSDDKITTYCNNKLKNMEMLENSQKYVNLLCSDKGSEIVIGFIKEKLLSEFSEEVISSVIEKINVQITRKEEKYIGQQVSTRVTPKQPQIHSQTLDDDSISPSEAKAICVKNGIILNGNITFASKNKSSNNYWANPNIGNLLNTWWLLLNDKKNRELNVFKIPANSIQKNQVVTRNDKPDLIDMQIKYADESFEDSRSKIKFIKWFVKKFSY